MTTQRHAMMRPNMPQKSKSYRDRGHLHMTLATPLCRPWAVHDLMHSTCWWARWGDAKDLLMTLNDTPQFLQCRTSSQGKPSPSAHYQAW